MRPLAARVGAGLVGAVGLLGLGWGVGGLRAQASPGDTTWDYARRRYVESRFFNPAAETRDAYAAIIRDLARGAPEGIVPEGLSARARPLGLLVRRDGDVVYLLEAKDHWRGAGVLAIRLGPLLEELVVQAPHPISDRYTGPVAGAMFDAGEVRAVYIATVYRRAGEDADPSALKRSWLSVATVALYDGLEDPLVVQLHGFDSATTDAELVLSSGRVSPGPWMADAPRAVVMGTGWTDLRTGADVPALAASKNAQGALLARYGGRFLHVELGLEAREALAREPDQVAGLRDALLTLARGER